MSNNECAAGPRYKAKLVMVTFATDDATKMLSDLMRSRIIHTCPEPSRSLQFMAWAADEDGGLPVVRIWAQATSGAKATPPRMSKWARIFPGAVIHPLKRGEWISSLRLRSERAGLFCSPATLDVNGVCAEHFRVALGTPVLDIEKHLLQYAPGCDPPSQPVNDSHPPTVSASAVSSFDSKPFRVRRLLAAVHGTNVTITPSNTFLQGPPPATVQRRLFQAGQSTSDAQAAEESAALGLHKRKAYPEAMDAAAPLVSTPLSTQAPASVRPLLMSLDQKIQLAQNPETKIGDRWMVLRRQMPSRKEILRTGRPRADAEEPLPLPVELEADARDLQTLTLSASGSEEGFIISKLRKHLMMQYYFPGDVITLSKKEWSKLEIGKIQMHFQDNDYICGNRYFIFVIQSSIRTHVVQAKRRCLNRGMGISFMPLVPNATRASAQIRSESAARRKRRAKGILQEKGAQEGHPPSTAATPPSQNTGATEGIVTFGGNSTRASAQTTKRIGSKKKKAPWISSRAEAQALHEQLLCMIHERQAEVAAAAVKGIGDEL